MNDSLEEKVRLNSLFDLYKALLTDKQREYFEYYYSEDYSLSEIADLFHISRNAVHDQIHIVAGHLEDFEAKLGLMKQRKSLSALAEQIRTEFPDNPQLAIIADQIEKTE